MKIEIRRIYRAVFSILFQVFVSSRGRCCPATVAFFGDLLRSNCRGEGPVVFMLFFWRPLLDMPFRFSDPECCILQCAATETCRLLTGSEDSSGDFPSLLLISHPSSNTAATGRSSDVLVAPPVTVNHLRTFL